MRGFVILALCLSGCTTFPEIDAASGSVAGPPPAFVPLDQLLAAPAPVAEARGAALAAQADALRRQVNP